MHCCPILRLPCFLISICQVDSSSLSISKWRGRVAATLDLRHRGCMAGGACDFEDDRPACKGGVKKVGGFAGGVGKVGGWPLGYQQRHQIGGVHAREEGWLSKSIRYSRCWVVGSNLATTRSKQDHVYLALVRVWDGCGHGFQTGENEVLLWLKSNIDWILIYLL